MDGPNYFSRTKYTYYLEKLNNFCRTGHTYYLDRMDPRILQELHEIVIDNKHKLTNNNIAKIVLTYYEKRHRKEKKMIQKATDMDYLRDNILPNVLPIVLQSFLESMIGTKKYTNKQMVIYKYARSTYTDPKPQLSSTNKEKRLVSGLLTISLHTSTEYQKRILILGEKHNYNDLCSSPIKDKNIKVIEASDFFFV